MGTVGDYGEEPFPYRSGFDWAQDKLGLNDAQRADYEAHVYDTVEQQVGDDVDLETKHEIADTYAVLAADTGRLENRGWANWLTKWV